MQPTTPRMNLNGFAQITHIAAFCANKPTNGGAYSFR